MKQFIDILKLDNSVLDDCKNLIDEFQLSLTLFTKFDEMWKRLGIKDRYLNKEVEIKLRNIAWLIFIIAKSKDPSSPAKSA